MQVTQKCQEQVINIFMQILLHHCAKIVASLCKEVLHRLARVIASSNGLYFLFATFDPGLPPIRIDAWSISEHVERLLVTGSGVVGLMHLPVKVTEANQHQPVDFSLLCVVPECLQFSSDAFFVRFHLGAELSDLRLVNSDPPEHLNHLLALRLFIHRRHSLHVHFDVMHERYHVIFHDLFQALVSLDHASVGHKHFPDAPLHTVERCFSVTLVFKQRRRSAKQSDGFQVLFRFPQFAGVLPQFFPGGIPFVFENQSYVSDNLFGFIFGACLCAIFVIFQ